MPGGFAAGDICGPPWQMAKAVGEGCIAGIAAAADAKKSKSSDSLFRGSSLVASGLK
ncbi:MAG: hypothetical protein PVH28_04020 [Desulfobacterales bacterium]